MGVDVDPYFVYGLTDPEDLPSKLPQYFMDWMGTDGGPFESEVPSRQYLVGLQLWENSYSGYFEGFGIEVDPKKIGTPEIDEVQKKVNLVCKKLKLPEPSFVNFVHWW